MEWRSIMPLEYRVRLEYSCLFPNTRSVLWRKTAIDAQALAPPSSTFLKPILNLKYEHNTIDPRFVHFFFKVEEWVDWFENFGDGRGYLHTQALGIYIVHAYAIIANTVL